ncbi:hypothetical protein CDEF62S_04782 [Castellaniella defragrans]
MLYALLDDGTAQIEVAIFNELYEQYRAILKEDRPLVIQGRVSHDDYSGGLRVSADDLYDLQRIRETRARSLRLTLPPGPDLQGLQSLLSPGVRRKRAFPWKCAFRRTVFPACCGWGMTGVCGWTNP